MSSIDNYANGAEQTRCHRNPPDECGRAVRLVCSYAKDADDARELFAVLGLDPREGCWKADAAHPRSAADPSAPQRHQLSAANRPFFPQRD